MVHKHGQPRVRAEFLQLASAWYAQQYGAQASHPGLRSTEEFLAKAAKWWDGRDEDRRGARRNGRPSNADNTMRYVHAAASGLKGALTQDAIIRATIALFEADHARIGEDATTPSHNPLRECVRAYLLYRRGLTKHDAVEPQLKSAIEKLSPETHTDCLMGMIGNAEKALPLHGSRALAAVDVTTRILAIATLPVLSRPSK